MFKFPEPLEGKPPFRLILTYELIKNPEMLAAAIDYIRHHTQVGFASVLLRAFRTPERPDCERAVRECDVPNVFANTYDLRGDRELLDLPLADLQNSIFLSQRGVNTYHGRQLEQPSRMEFGQACGEEYPFRPVSDARALGVEMISGFETPNRQLRKSNISHLLAIMWRARWTQRVTLEQLMSPEETGRLFGFRDERTVIA